MEAHAGISEGVGQALGLTVESGTPLSPVLLEIASTSVAQSASAALGSNDALQGCLVAILCAHAAVEAQMNQAAAALGEWWEDRERQPVELKWADLVERLTGTRSIRSSQVRKAMVRLTTDRNRIAHFRGVPMADGKLRVSGPPVKASGNITQVRAYFSAERAADRLKDAQQAIAAISTAE